MVQKARDADVFGILIGTLGVGETKGNNVTRETPARLVDQSFSNSAIPSDDQTHPRPAHTRAEEGLHRQRREAEPIQARQLHRDRVLRPRGVSGEQRDQL